MHHRYRYPLIDTKMVFIPPARSAIILFSLTSTTQYGRTHARDAPLRNPSLLRRCGYVSIRSDDVSNECYCPHLHGLMELVRLSLYGVVLVQAYTYALTCNSDTSWLKALVTAIM